MGIDYLIFVLEFRFPSFGWSSIARYILYMGLVYIKMVSLISNIVRWADYKKASI